MIYSCFNQNTGLYRYFQDAKALPINGDLPVPKLPAKAGKVGVAALEAARTMPRGAKPCGTGWHARGIVVRCPGGALSGFGELSQQSHGVILLAASVAMLLLLSSGEWK